MQKENLEIRKSEIVLALSDYETVFPEGIENARTENDEQVAKLQKEIAALDELTQELDIIGAGYVYTFDDESGESTATNYSAEERAELLEEFIEEYPELVSGLTLNFALTSNDNNMSLITEESSYKVVGVLCPVSTPENYVQHPVFFSDDTADGFWDIQKSGMSYSEVSSNYKDEAGALYTKLYVPYDHSDSQTNYLWSVYVNEDFSEDDSRIDLNGTYVDTLKMIDMFVVELSTVFFYVGLVFAVFAILLFSNFISVSISQKRREIGILRAVGARSLDVFKIFFSESLVIAAICSALSIGGSVVLCQILNTELGSAIGASIFVFGIASVLIIIGIALLTAALATFLPVWNAAKKKPVDSIRSL